MTRKEYRAAALDAAYLAACAVNGEKPDSARVGRMDTERLYQAADRHQMTAVTAMALESAGVRDGAFTQAKGKAIRKAAALDMERAAVLDALEKAGIWYMPLKGAVLKDLYPRLGMRQMSDNDILIDGTRVQDVQALMEGLGFSYDHSGAAQNAFYKEPVCSFEMHYALFTPARLERLYKYYGNVKERLVKDEGNGYGYHFSDEDFYVYMIAHEYKHYTDGGIGLRALLDVYVYCEKKGETLDWRRITGELEKLGIADFEAKNRRLALRLFSGEALDRSDRKRLDYMLFSGAYGTAENRTRNVAARKGRAVYLLSRAFPSKETMQTLYPVLGRRPLLLPVCWIMRLINAWRTKRQKALSQLRAVFRR